MDEFDISSATEMHDPVSVEWMILADFVDLVNSKLYLSGGGWDTLHVPQLPMNRNVGVALAVRVPWNQTNQGHTFRVEIMDEDAHHKLANVNGRLEVGRPPGIQHGQSQRAQIAMNFNLRFEQNGVYVVVAQIDDREAARFVFRVASGGKPGR